MALSSFLVFFCFSVSAAVSAVNSDGKALLSLFNHWAVVPYSVQLSWNDSDSYPCPWVGVECDQKNQFVVALNLSGYKISGQLGQEIASLKRLKSVDLSMNSFSGSIPSELGNCSLLEYLDLSANSFTGTIPSNVGNCSALQELHLNGNFLTGKIPPALGKCNLLFMDLSNNSFNGGIPSSLGNLKNIISVDLSMNKLSGLIPPEMGRLVNLQALNLSHNTLNGELPSELSNCKRLLHLDASHNLLNGPIPSSFSRLTELSTLTLSENGLTSNIPAFLFEFRKLSKLQLGGNSLGGNIPSAIGSLGAIQNLMLLNLSSNMLMGEVPIQLRGLTELERIDISRNNLSGSLRFLQDVRSLVFVNVSYNNFTGPIPSTLVKFMNSLPSSFAGNSGLFVNCFPLDCIGNKNSSISQPSKKKGHRRTKIAIIVLGSSLPLGFLVAVLIKVLRRGKRSHSKELELYGSDFSHLDILKAIEDPNAAYITWKGGQVKVVCSHLDILKATDDLNDAYIIGKGGQGTVYKVTLSPETVFVAKKHQFAGIKSGSRSMTREIQTIGKIKHRNLIQFMGSWSGENYGLVLYSYLENGSLHDILHERKPRVQLDWNTRYKIALGMAHGLSYLHFDCVPPILHRDIKPKNILLNNEFEPHISDFGLSILLDSNATSPPRLVGTGGYFAPENAFKAKTMESDVYAFGVILLELITRKKAIDPSFDRQPDIVSWVRSITFKTIEIQHLVDPDLIYESYDQIVKDQILSLLVLAMRCTQHDWNKRPSMREVVNQLLQIQWVPRTHYSRTEVGSSSNS